MFPVQSGLFVSGKPHKLNHVVLVPQSVQILVDYSGFQQLGTPTGFWPRPTPTGFIFQCGVAPLGVVVEHQEFKGLFTFQACELDSGFRENLFKAVDMLNHCRELHSSVTVNDFMQRICNRVLLVSLQPFKAKGGGILTT